MAILLVTHDIQLAAAFASRMVVMERGAVVETGESSAVMANPQHPYTRQLITAVPRPVAPDDAPPRIPLQPAGARCAGEGGEAACCSK